MMRRSLAVELLEDCVFSARAATAGGHESLDRIPGATLLGAAASRLYGMLDRREAWAAFHSGRLRFGDGLPYDGHGVAYPVPLAWYYPKAERPEADGRLDRGRIHNFLEGDGVGGGAQPKQLRTGYVGPGGRWIRPERALRLKTAIEPATGRAAEGQLFGYDALACCQRFAASIEADPDFDEALFEKVVSVLSGEVLLGRSRSAEYGRAGIAPIELGAPQPGPVQGRRLTLWLLSDLALAGADGQPTLTPSAESLGLPAGRVVWERTFLRSRRYSPWNAARGGYDAERLVLAAGGVISLDLAGSLDEAQAARLHDGIGLYREAGLGRLWVNPPLLAGTHPDFAPASQAHSPAVPTRPDHPLVGWLEGQSGDWKTKAEEQALTLAVQYHEQVERARRAAGVARDLSFGPSRSQWGRVLEAAREKAGRELFQALFTGDAAVIKPQAEGWSVEVQEDGGWQTLADWFKTRLAATGEARAYAHRVRGLAHRVREDMGKRRV